MWSLSNMLSSVRNIPNNLRMKASDLLRNVVTMDMIHWDDQPHLMQSKGTKNLLDQPADRIEEQRAHIDENINENINHPASPSPRRDCPTSCPGRQCESDGTDDSASEGGGGEVSSEKYAEYTANGNIMIGDHATITYIQPQAKDKMDTPGVSDKSMDDNVPLGKRASQGDLGGIVKAGQDITFGDNPEIRTITQVEKKPLQIDCRVCDDKMSVADLLSELGLQNLEPNFQKHGIDTIEMCRTLTDQDMEDLGLTRIGDRKRFQALLKRGERDCVPSPCTPTVLNAGGSIIFGKGAKITAEVYVPASSTDGMEEYFDKGRNS